MAYVIKGTDFDYRIDTEYGINHDGFIAEGTESIVFKGIKYGNDLIYSCVLKFKPRTRLRDFMKREYKILEALQTCRSVVRVLDVIEDLGDFKLPYGGGFISTRNFFCVVEEFIDGESLQDYCINQWFRYNTVSRKWERNSTEHNYREIVKYQNQMIQFMINLCEIMKFVSNINIHNAKNDPNKPVILHCDIKPENIMVTKHGRELVLIDFGRSHEFMDDRTYQHYNDLTNMTFIADYSDRQWQDVGKDNFYAYGTVGYAAPECYAEALAGYFPFTSQSSVFVNGCVSIESDIFGFGTTFYECLSIYEMCSKYFEASPESSDPRFFNRAIMNEYEDAVRNGNTLNYCDRDFRFIDKAYHESLEAIIRKCTATRQKHFQDPDMDMNVFYHNFAQLQEDIEHARDSIPSLDRKSDPLVRQMLAVSGFCAAFASCFLGLWLILMLLANPLAKDRWKTMKKNYTDNQKKTALTRAANDLMKVPGKKTKLKNFDDIIEFVHGGSPNDTVIDIDETELLTSLMKEYISDKSEWGDYIDTIIQNGKSDNMDDIAKNIYLLNLPTDNKSSGYDLAKALTQVNEAADNDTDKLKSAYDVLLENCNDIKYSTISSKLAMKLMSGEKTDTLAEAEGTDRETIQNTLVPITKLGGD